MALAPRAAADELPLGSSLAGLLDHARSVHPELRMRALETEVLRERAEAAGALPDPRFQIELMDFTNTESGRASSLLPGEVGMTRYRLIQPLPFWGKRELRHNLAGLQAGQGELAREQSALEIGRRIATAHARRVQLLGQQRIQRETLDLLEALERLVVTRYGVGLVPQQDALRAQAEITAIKVDLIDTARRLRETQALLNSLLVRPADAPLAEPGEALPHAALPPATALATAARSHSPELAGLRLAVESSQAARALVERERFPDLAVGLTNNRPRNGKDNWDLMLEVNIPLQQSRRRAEERAAGREQEAAGARLAAAELRTEGRIGELLAAIDGARDKARLLLHTALPQSRASLQAAEAAYGAGRVNFDTLIEAERQILRTRLALLEAEMEARIGLAELEQIVGISL